MKNQHVVGEVRKALTPEEVASTLVTFRGQRNEIENQLINGVRTTEEVQAFIEHRPIIRKENGPMFWFNGVGLFPGAEAFYFDPTSFNSDKLSFDESFLKAFCGYSQIASEKSSMAVCEFIGTPTDAQILAMLGGTIRIGLPQLFWAIDQKLIESKWSHVCYITDSKGIDKAVSFYKKEKTFISCKTVSDTGWWSSNIRVLGQNRFCPK